MFKKNSSGSGSNSINMNNSNINAEEEKRISRKRITRENKHATSSSKCGRYIEHTASTVEIEYTSEERRKRKKTERIRDLKINRKEASFSVLDFDFKSTYQMFNRPAQARRIRYKYKYICRYMNLNTTVLYLRCMLMQYAHMCSHGWMAVNK